MIATQSLICSFLLLPTLVLAQCPPGIYAAAGAILSNYPPAQSYCSSKYPAKTVWATSYTTSITIVGTSLGTTTLATTTSTVTAAAVTSPITVTTETINQIVDTTTSEQTETTLTYTTRTITCGEGIDKRATSKAPTKVSSTSKDAKQSAFSSFAKQANAFVSTVCVKCVGTAHVVTSTTTLPIFSRVTASSTSSVTITKTETTTPTVLSTITATSFADVTQTDTQITTTTATVRRFEGSNNCVR